MRFLFDGGSDGDHVFVRKDKLVLLSYSKRLVSQLWPTLNGIFQSKRKAKIELNLFDFSDSKRYYSEPDVVEYKMGSRSQYDRGGIDKNLRKMICPKINFEVWKL